MGIKVLELGRIGFMKSWKSAERDSAMGIRNKGEIRN